jgi:small subunit ribosomal protein S20
LSALELKLKILRKTAPKNGPFVYRLGRQVFILVGRVRFPYGLLKSLRPFIRKIMANHKSAIKRIRSNEAKRLRNRYQHKSTRTAIKKLKELTDKTEAQKLFPTVVSMIDKLAKKNIIHANKAANLKSQLSRQVAAL